MGCLLVGIHGGEVFDGEGFFLVWCWVGGGSGSEVAELSLDSGGGVSEVRGRIGLVCVRVRGRVVLKCQVYNSFNSCSSSGIEISSRWGSSLGSWVWAWALAMAFLCLVFLL